MYFCILLRNPFVVSPWFYVVIQEKGWDSGGGRRRPCAPSIFLLPLWPDSAPPPPIGCYVTDTGGSQAAQHRSTAAYTIAHQTVTVFITQVRSNCLPSHPASILATPTQDSWPQHCWFSCDKTGLHFAPGPGLLDKALPLIPSLSFIGWLQGCRDCQEK